MWIFLREHSPKTPGWGGFVSITSDPPKRITTIGYYPVIHKPITEYKTVQECLRLAEEATHEVEKEYTITTFHLVVCMEAYPVVWKVHNPHWNISPDLCLLLYNWNENENNRLDRCAP